MLANHKLAKSIQDASWGEFLRQLNYKSKWHDKICVQVDRFYPSSQTCGECGYINKEVKDLKVRSWICPKCGTQHDCDQNVAINILTEGLRIYTAGHAEIYACGERCSGTEHNGQCETSLVDSRIPRLKPWGVSIGLNSGE
jgi:transposase